MQRKLQSIPQRSRSWMDISCGTKLKSGAPLQPEIDQSLHISFPGERTGHGSRAILREGFKCGPIFQAADRVSKCLCPVEGPQLYYTLPAVPHRFICLIQVVCPRGDEFFWNLGCSLRKFTRRRLVKQTRVTFPIGHPHSWPNSPFHLLRYQGQVESISCLESH